MPKIKFDELEEIDGMTNQEKRSNPLEKVSFDHLPNEKFNNSTHKVAQEVSKEPLHVEEKKFSHKERQEKKIKIKANVTSKVVSQPIIIEAPKTNNSQYKSFEYDYWVSYGSRLYSIILVGFAAEIVNHILLFIEGKNILDIHNFHSIIFSKLEPTWAVTIITLVLVFLTKLSPPRPVIIRKDGIVVQKSSVASGFLMIDYILLPWVQIKKCWLSHRLLHPYLVFFDDVNTELGRVNFLLKDTNSFLKYLQESAPKDSPVVIMTTSLLKKK